MQESEKYCEVQIFQYVVSNLICYGTKKRVKINDLTPLLCQSFQNVD